MWFHRTRFPGAGASADREFHRQLRRNLREDWRIWSSLTAGMIGFIVWSLAVDGVAGRFLAATGGFLGGVIMTVAALGGHVSAFLWWQGAEGERETARQIERLDGGWHCEHDLEHGRGNWDHVLVGPSGVFLLDSKMLNGKVTAEADQLRSGRILISGSVFRGAALRMKNELEHQLGQRAPWVQAVVVVWGSFPQGVHREQEVVYVAGEQLVSWLAALPPRLNAPQRAALVAALREVRASVGSTVTAGHGVVPAPTA